jgi:hypothetical protein
MTDHRDLLNRFGSPPKQAGSAHHTFVIAPFFYQNLVGSLAPQKQEDATLGWALPIDPTVRAIHMGDITELGNIVAGAFAHPDEAGNGEYLALVGDFMSFNEIVDTLSPQGHKFSFKQVPREVFATLFPGAAVVYLPGFEFVRPNCARKQNSRRATDQVLDVGSTECPGSDTLNALAPVHGEIVHRRRGFDHLKAGERWSYQPQFCVFVFFLPLAFALTS